MHQAAPSFFATPICCGWATWQQKIGPALWPDSNKSKALQKSHMFALGFPKAAADTPLDTIARVIAVESCPQKAHSPTRPMEARPP
jgi:hypothetical protein